MTSRIYGWTVDCVHVLNVIDIVFADDETVRMAWKDLNDKYHVSNPDQQHLKKIETAQYKLLEAIANSLGYKDKVTWETIQNPYIPDGMFYQLQAQKESQKAYSNILAGMNQMMPQKKQNGESQKSDEKSNLINFIVGFGQNVNEYEINGVRYIVESRLEPIDFRHLDQNTRIDQRLEHNIPATSQISQPRRNLLK